MRMGEEEPLPIVVGNQLLENVNICDVQVSVQIHTKSADENAYCAGNQVTDNSVKSNKSFL